MSNTDSDVQNRNSFMLQARNIVIAILKNKTFSSQTQDPQLQSPLIWVHPET